MNYELRIKNYEKGFTLIELLAATVVIVTVGLIIVAIIVSTLRGTNKTNTISTARQNGTYAISQVSKLLRFTQSIDALDGDSTKNCITNTPLPAVQAPTPHTSITFTNIDGGVTTLACVIIPDRDNAMTIASVSGELDDIDPNLLVGSLIDTDVVQIPEDKCNLTCNQTTSSDAILVGIQFSLETVRQDGSVFSEFSAAPAPLEFNTSVILRNVGR